MSAIVEFDDTRERRTDFCHYIVTKLHPLLGTHKLNVFSLISA